jgi:hypothetical protein
MADDERHDPDSPDPSLQLPSLRSAFRRRRRERSPDDAESAPDDSVALPQTQQVDGPELSPGPVGLPEAHPEVTSPLLVATEDALPRDRRRIRLPGPVAAVLTGAVVGLVLVGLTAASLHVCSDLRGASSCGKPGILVLLAITAAVIVLGSLLLRVAGVPAHGSTSFLGVGLLVVLILLALLPVLDEWWVVIAVPALAMATFAASWWLTTTYAEPGDRAR